MSPEQAIASLDRAIDAAWKEVIIRRDGEADLTIRARVRETEPREYVGMVPRDVSQVIISPTSLNGVSWPLPIVIGDLCVHDGRERKIEEVNPLDIGGQLVRIELRCVG